MKIVMLHMTIYSFSFTTEKKNEVEETRIFKLIYQFFVRIIMKITVGKMVIRMKRDFLRGNRIVKGRIKT